MTNHSRRKALLFEILYRPGHVAFGLLRTDHPRGGVTTTASGIPKNKYRISICSGNALISRCDNNWPMDFGINAKRGAVERLQESIGAIVSQGLSALRLFR